MVEVLRRDILQAPEHPDDMPLHEWLELVAPIDWIARIRESNPADPGLPSAVCRAKPKFAVDDVKRGIGCLNRIHRVQ